MKVRTSTSFVSLVLCTKPYDKGTRVSEVKEFREPFLNYQPNLSECNAIEVDITCYRGDLLEPLWTDEEPGTFNNCINRVEPFRNLDKIS